MYIFFNTDCDWEKDYILKEIFPFGKIIFITPFQMLDINFYKHLFKNNEYGFRNNCVFVLGGLIHGNRGVKDPCSTFLVSRINNKNYLHNFRYLKFKKIFDYLRPIVTFFLSDEYGKISYLENLGYRTKLLFRNYYHHNYYGLHINPKPKNINWHPLGYNSNYIECNDWKKNCIDSTNQGIYNINQKKYFWSFIGDFKNNTRKGLIEKFRDIKPHYYDNNIDRKKMFEIYSQSVVVLNTRGWISLDCLRLYETVVAGAIPVLVGNRKEAQFTFMKEENPPWIFCDNIEQAFDICIYLFNNLHIAQERINIIRKWWQKRITRVRKQVLDCVYDNKMPY